jgi:hypothetical protein
MRSKAKASAQQWRNISSDSLCSPFSPSSPTATIFLKPDAHNIFIKLVIRTDDAGPKSIGNPLQKENIMKKEDLTQVKHIGALRMKMLISSGITTIRQLHQISLEKLAQVKTIGPHYAKLIKAAVAESYGKKPVKSAPKAVAARKRKTVAVDPDLNKRITVLKKRLKQANEKLKPLDKKKYIDFKKRSKTLKTHLGGLNKNPGSLSEKVTKNIIKNADALSAVLKNVGKKPKKKKYQKVSQEIQSFSKMLKKTRS